MNEHDWTQPSASEEYEDLWQALHDATILGIQSDRLQRALSISVEVGFPEPPEPYPQQVNIALRGVTHALVFLYLNWPGPWPSPTIPITPEKEAAVRAYRESARVETASLDVFDRWLADETELEVKDARLGRRHGGLTLTLDGTTNDPSIASGWQLRVAAEALSVDVGDGTSLDLDELLRLGRAGWEAWAADKEARRSGAAVATELDGDEEPGGKKP